MAADAQGRVCRPPPESPFLSVSQLKYIRSRICAVGEQIHAGRVFGFAALTQKRQAAACENDGIMKTVVVDMAECGGKIGKFAAENQVMRLVVPSVQAQDATVCEAGNPPVG